MEKLTHFTEEGKAKMVDISEKNNVKRIAIAHGFIKLSEETLEKIKNNEIIKGDVLTIAKIAGINAAKQTAFFIPLTHPINLEYVDLTFDIENDGIKVLSTVVSYGKTGVEMEALHSVSLALLTIYDMCKSVDKNMEIKEIKLIKKEKI